MRRWEALRAQVEATVEDAAAGAHAPDGAGANTTPCAAPRDALAARSARRTRCCAGGAFVSLTDPPPGLRAEAEACVNAGVWPVLVGEAGDRSTMLSSPIILPDHPQIAPESPGDLFDAGEIDQMLVLNILA